MRTVGSVRPKIQHFVAVFRDVEFPFKPKKIPFLHLTDNAYPPEVVIFRFRLVGEFVNGVAGSVHDVAVIGDVNIAARICFVIHYDLDGLFHISGDGPPVEDHGTLAADIQPFDDPGAAAAVDLYGTALQIDGLGKGIVPVFIELQNQRGARFHGHFGNLKSLIDIGIDHVCAVFHRHQLGNAQGLCHNVFQIQRVTFPVEGTVIFAVMSRIQILFAVRPVFVHPF